MADAKPTGQHTQSAPSGKKYGRAGESADPQVQQLLAERQTAVSNGDDDSIDAIDKRLRDEHGVTAE